MFHSMRSYGIILDFHKDLIDREGLDEGGTLEDIRF